MSRHLNRKPSDNILDMERFWSWVGSPLDNLCREDFLMIAAGDITFKQYLIRELLRERACKAPQWTQDSVKQDERGKMGTAHSDSGKAKPDMNKTSESGSRQFVGPSSLQMNSGVYGFGYQPIFFVPKPVVRPMYYPGYHFAFRTSKFPHQCKVRPGLRTIQPISQPRVFSRLPFVQPTFTYTHPFMPIPQPISYPDTTNPNQNNNFLPRQQQEQMSQQQIEKNQRKHDDQQHPFTVNYVSPNGSTITMLSEEPQHLNNDWAPWLQDCPLAAESATLKFQ